MKESDRKRWSEGVVLDGEKTRAAEVFVLRREPGKTWLEVTLYEGRNQQIRKMGDATAFPVMRLSRTSFAGITSEGLRPGQFRPLLAQELQDLKKDFGVPRKVPRADGSVGQTTSAPKPAVSPRVGRRRLTARGRAPTPRRTGG